MKTFSIDRPELIQLMVDAIEDEYGSKAVDNVDLELIADITMANLESTIENAVSSALDLACKGNKKRKAS